MQSLWCGVVASLLVLTWGAEVSAQSAPTWGGEQDSVKVFDLGRIIGAKQLQAELRTQMAGLESSFVRVRLLWVDQDSGQEREQVIVEEERAARFEQYTISIDKPTGLLLINYPCPTTRGDSETQCTQRFALYTSSKRFVDKGVESTNPVAKSRDALIEQIRKGDFKKAKEGVALLQKSSSASGKKLDTDPFFVAAFEHAFEQAQRAYWAKDYPKAHSIIVDFLEKPPFVSSQRCPDKEQLSICLRGKWECGCSDDFGILPNTPKYAARLEYVAKIMHRAKDWQKLTLLMEPVAQRHPQQRDLRLYLADAYWALDRQDKARPHYAAVRQLALASGEHVPPHVFERFRAP